jgi:microcin C transport system substrate-binding protein
MPSVSDGTVHYGLSPFGTLELPEDFPYFPYVDPLAKKGGVLITQPRKPLWNQSSSTFNTLNIYAPKGDGAAGMEGRASRRDG